MSAGGFKRVVVIGCTGSGKTTFCNKLSQITGLPHIELDAVNWLPNWTPSPHFVEDVNRILQENDSWIIDGNNEKVRETVWATAEAVIWLDYSFLTVIWRLIKRTAARLLFNQTLWNGNHERWRVALSWNSVVLWGVTMWFRYKTEFPEWFSKYPSLRIIHLYDDNQTEQFLSSIHKIE